MKIALIGASGFIGSHLISRIKDEAYELLNIDKAESVMYPELTTIANVLDKKALTKLLRAVDLVVLLAAEHRDDVSPTSLYYDVNVGGMQNTLEAMEANGVKRLIFLSSVAVYGLNKDNPNEEHPADPFNHYGKSKWQAEVLLRRWLESRQDWNVNILRPTVVFGERNRGNVYNLLKQISSGRFMMVGKGENKKSMAYIGNIVAFIHHLIEHQSRVHYEVYNYVDKPDFSTKELVKHVSNVLEKHIPTTSVPFWIGMMGGYCFDALALVSKRKLAISSVRVRKFCANTVFDAAKVGRSGFHAPYTLAEGITRTLQHEFISPKKDNITFVSE